MKDFKCKKCKVVFPMKWYKFYENEQGFREKIIGHIKRHQEDDLIKEWSKNGSRS